MEQERLHVAVAGGALAVTALTSIPHLHRLATSPWRFANVHQAWYEDIDGRSTPEAMAAFGSSLRRSKWAMLLTAAAATACAVAVTERAWAFDATAVSVEDVLGLASWIVTLTVHVPTMWTTWTETYRLGAWSFLANLFVTSGPLLQFASVSYTERMDDISFYLKLAQAISGVLYMVSCITIRRRPHLVDAKGRSVDWQYSCTALDRFTYSFMWKIIYTAKAKHDLDTDDLYVPDHAITVAVLMQDWARCRMPTQRPLWLQIVTAHSWKFILAWTMVMFVAIGEFLPSLFVLKVVQMIEAGDDERGLRRSWFMIAGIMAAVQFDALAVHIFYNFEWSRLAIPVRAQLEGLLFQKSLRKQDIQDLSACKEKVSDNDSKGDQHHDGDGGGAATASATSKNEMNLISYDAQRVAHFSAYSAEILPRPICNTIVCFAFLGSLLGWRPLAVMLVLIVIFMGLQTWFIKSYAVAKDKVMQVRDTKIASVTEAIDGIKQIKFSATEEYWNSKINANRNTELRRIWILFMWDLGLWITYNTISVIMTVALLSSYSYFEGRLTPAVAFSAISALNMYTNTLISLPDGLSKLTQSIISVRRLDGFLRRPDVKSVRDPKATTVSISSASIAWPAAADTPLDDRFILRDVNVIFPRGTLSLISGKTGTGKSLLLTAILGDADVISGRISVPACMEPEEDDHGRAMAADWIVTGTMAYVAQIPWIENASVRDNILFGLPMDRQRYDAVLDACALRKDIEMFEDGELTEIGANGINISGGQKWRLTLARAIYSRAEILVMDDVFSAVDAHVGQHILDHCLAGALCRDRTTILVTHHIGLCRGVASYIVELANGGVAYAGPVEDAPGDLITLDSAEKDRQAELRREKEAVEERQLIEERRRQKMQADGRKNDAHGLDRNGHPRDDGQHAAAGTRDRVPRRLIEAEKREKGAVKKAVWKAYFEASGGVWFVLGAAVLFAVVQACYMGRSWWVKIWTGKGEDRNTLGQFETVRGLMTTDSAALDDLGSSVLDKSTLEQTILFGRWLSSSFVTKVVLAPLSEERGLGYYLGIYLLISALNMVGIIVRCYYVCVGVIRASENMFRRLTTAVLRMPMRWFDTTPRGRLLNRFTKDFAMIDDELLDAFNEVMAYGFNALGTFLSAVIVSPMIALCGLPLVLISYYLGINYAEGSRPVKRLMSTNMSLVMDHYVATVNGAATIRAFGRQERYMAIGFERIDDSASSTRHFWLFYRWLGWRVTCVSAILAGIVSAVVLLDVRISAGAAGFTLSFAMSMPSTLFHAIRVSTFFEATMNSAERVLEYASAPTETQAGDDAPAAWPAEGRIEVDGLVVAYAPELPVVLKKVSFDVRPGERIGVVGRTGSGKSSLTLALFRFLEARKGSIRIDGIDISTLKLRDLRSRLAIIPQDPVLFAGTIRSNLDPTGTLSDAQLLEALDRVHLVPAATPTTTTPSSSAVSTASTSLSASATMTQANPMLSLASTVSVGGHNLSQGQRQLLCLARAIVTRLRIIVLDEATSSIDSGTDALIQKSIRDEFGGSTLLVVAHRLATVADFDRILVLGDGEVREFGTPRELWAAGGEFRSLCEMSGDLDLIKRMIGV